MSRYGPRRGWPVKPDPARARIDWSKPLARGLVGVWLFHEGGGAPTDLTGGPAATATAPGWGTGLLGPVVRPTANISVTAPRLGADESFTIAVRHQPIGGRGGAVYRTSSQDWSINAYHDSNSPLFAVVTMSGGAAQYNWTNSPALSYTLGQWSTSVYQFEQAGAAGALRVWVDGVQGGTTSMTTTTLRGTSGEVWLPSQVAGAGDDVDWVVVWKRALSAGEVQRLSADPLGSLLWQPRAVPLSFPTAAGQYLRPASDVAAGTWTPVPGSPATFYDKLDETSADDADYAYSATYPSSDVLTVSLSSATDPTSSTGHVVRYRYWNKNGGGQGTLLVELLEGTTVIASWTHSGVTSATPVQANQTLTGTQADSIGNYGNLRLRFTASVG